MSEGEKDAEKRAEEGKTSGKNGNASNLINAAIWIFIVSGFSIVTSAFYVFGLSLSLNFDFAVYFGVKDYLEVIEFQSNGGYCSEFGWKDLVGLYILVVTGTLRDQRFLWLGVSLLITLCSAAMLVGFFFASFSEGAYFHHLPDGIE
jgi:hypothetical protein